MSNNTALFDSVLSAIGASNQSWLTVPVVDESPIAIAIATEVDSLIAPIGGGATLSQRCLIESVTKGIIAGRTPSSLDPSSYSDISHAIAQVFNQFAPHLQNTSTGSAVGGLTSFNGRVAPAAVPTAGDYGTDQVTNNSTVAGLTDTDALNNLKALAGCAKSGTTTTGTFACAENLNTIASGNNSHAEGNAGESRGTATHAEGFHGLAAGNNSHVEGDTCGTSAAATASHAEGNGTNCTGVNSHCEGRGGTAQSDGSHVEGVNGNATGTGSHAEGVACGSVGTGAHSEGFQCTANADTTHAEGQGTQALGTSSHAEGYFTVASGNASHAGGAVSRAWLNCDYAHSGAGFATAGDAQYRAGEPKASTNGSLPGESSVMVQGVLGEPVSLQNSTSYGITVRATATKMGLGAAPRQSIYFHFEFLLDVDSAGVVTVSAVTQVVGPIINGAAFVGATLVPTGVNRVGATPAQLALTWTIAGGLTIQSHIVAHIEYVEILGT